jgi:hypothetical protein
MKNSNARRGLSLTQLMLGMVVMATVTFLGTVISQHANVLSQTSTHVETSASLRDRILAIRAHIPQWFALMRTSVSGVNACLPTQASAEFKAGTFECGTSGSSKDASVDAEVLHIAAGRIVSPTPMVDLEGKSIAGTVATPVYFTAEGIPCASPTVPGCIVRSESYLIRSQAVGNPGAVEFVVKVTGLSVAPLVERIPLGTAWTNISNDPGDSQTQNFTKDECAPGELSQGVDGESNLRCFVPPRALCAAGQYLQGIQTDGTAICQLTPALPPPLPTLRKVAVYCRSPKKGNKYTSCGIPGLCVGSKPVGAPAWDGKGYKDKGCDFGDEVRYSDDGQFLMVRDQCKGTFTLSIQDPPGVKLSADTPPVVTCP